jgi:sec-independent protein translocase protein TatA
MVKRAWPIAILVFIFFDFYLSITMCTLLLFLGNLGATELTLIFLVVLLLFGGNKIPELMRGLGRGIREFNSAKNSVEDEIRQGMREAEKKPLEK